MPRARQAPDGRQSGGTQSTDISRINRRVLLAPPLPMTQKDGVRNGVRGCKKFGSHRLTPEVISTTGLGPCQRGGSSVLMKWTRNLCKTASELDFCPSVRSGMTRRASHVALPYQPTMQRVLERTRSFPVMTVGVLRMPGRQSVCENTIAPIMPGVHTPSYRKTSLSIYPSKRVPRKRVRNAEAADRAVPPSCRARTSRG